MTKSPQDGYYHNEETVQQYISMARGYDGRHLIDTLKRYLSAQSTVLELGAGPGTDLKILSAYYRVTGSDNSPIFLKLIAETRPDIPLLELDAISIDTGQTFDAIYSNKVLQHLSDPELLCSIENQCKRLNSGGIICHSFWNGDQCEYLHGLLHNYHTATELETWFSPHFDILLLEPYAEMEADDSLLLIGRKML